MPNAQSPSLSHAQVWDDSALLRSWDAALAEYKVSLSLRPQPRSLQLHLFSFQTISQVHTHAPALTRSCPNSTTTACMHAAKRLQTCSPRTTARKRPPLSRSPPSTPPPMQVMLKKTQERAGRTQMLRPPPASMPMRVLLPTTTRIWRHRTIKPRLHRQRCPHRAAHKRIQLAQRPQRRRRCYPAIAPACHTLHSTVCASPPSTSSLYTQYLCFLPHVRRVYPG